MSAIVVTRPSGGELFVASAVAMMLSLMTMGVFVALLALVGEGMAGLAAGAGVLLMGAFLGLIGGPTGAPIAVLSGTLLFLIFGRALAKAEISSGIHMRAYWVGAGAAVGVLVETVRLVEHSAYAGFAFIGFSSGLPFYGPALVTGMVGMLSWHALVVALTRRRD